jgi:hypothetical protein
MSSPLFIQTPIIAQAEVTWGLPTPTELFAATGPTLIERVLWCAWIGHSGYEVISGQIMFFLEEYGTGATRGVKTLAIVPEDPAVTGKAFCGEVQLDLVIDDGWALKVGHSVLRNGSHPMTLDFTVQGGVLG